MLHSNEEYAFTSTLRLSSLSRQRLLLTCALIPSARVMCIAIVSFMLQFASLQSAMAVEPDAANDAAEPVPVETATTADSIVLLGVFVDGKADKGLRDVVTDRLSRLGQDVTLAPEHENQGCKQTACYAEVSTRKNASRVLRVDVYESSNRRYFVEGTIYERAKGSSRPSSAGCDDCSSENLRALLGDLAARLVTTPDKPAVRPPPRQLVSGGAPQPAIALIPSPVPPPRPLSRWTPGRIALVTVLSTLTGAALIGTIVSGTTSAGVGMNQQVCTLDEKVRPTMPPPCISRTALTVASGLLTGLSATGLALSLQQILGKEAAF